MIDVAIVGSGPNGLAAAIHLARAGKRVRVFETASEIGGGTRSAALTLPGFLHDVCSAVHPFGVLSPFFRSLPLAEHGLTWIQPPVMIAHPLDDGTAVAVRSEIDGPPRYRSMVGPLARHLPELADDLLAPIAHVPKHPLMLASFGLPALLSAKVLANLFDDARTRALFAGCAAHSFRPLDAPMTAAFSLLLTASAHAFGWPFARGGSQSIAHALASILRSDGGEIVTDNRIDSLPNTPITIFDTSPHAMVEIAGLPPLRRWQPGPGVFKVDYALSAPVPWRAEECRRAGTVHVGGSFEDIAASESAVAQGAHPARPFVLVAQPSLFDPTRAPAGCHTLWAYCHVPNGSRVDMTERIDAQIERFAPGFSDVVLARHTMNTFDLEAHNPNYIGGDISGGVTSPFEMLPYSTAAKGVFLCSASTAPGAGVHGMCGYHAAEKVLSVTGGIAIPSRLRRHHSPDSRRSAHVVNRY